MRLISSLPFSLTLWIELIELSDFSEYRFVESSKADDDETVELVDLLSSSMLLRIESSDDQASLPFVAGTAESLVGEIVVGAAVVMVSRPSPSSDLADFV